MALGFFTGHIVIIYQGWYSPQRMIYRWHIELVVIQKVIKGFNHNLRLKEVVFFLKSKGGGSHQRELGRSGFCSGAKPHMSTKIYKSSEDKKRSPDCLSFNQNHWKTLFSLSAQALTVPPSAPQSLPRLTWNQVKHSTFALYGLNRSASLHKPNKDSLVWQNIQQIKTFPSFSGNSFR